jgi:guanylate kinase
LGNNALAVFLRPPSVEILMQRLRNRSTEVEHELQMRINKANEELSYESQYEVVIVNDVLQKTLEESETIVKAFIEN